MNDTQNVIWSHTDYSGDKALLVRRLAKRTEQPWSLVVLGGDEVFLTREAMIRLRDAINAELFPTEGAPETATPVEIEGEQPCGCGEPTTIGVIHRRGLPCHLEEASLPEVDVDPWTEVRNDISRMRVAIEGIAATMARAQVKLEYADHVDVGSGYSQNLGPDDDREQCGHTSIRDVQCSKTDGHEDVHEFPRHESPRCTSSMNGNRCTKENRHTGYHVWAPAPSDDEGWKR